MKGRKDMSLFVKLSTHPALTYLKSTTETSEQCMNSVQS